MSNSWGEMAEVVVGVRGGELEIAQRGVFTPETEYRARCTQYWWGVVKTSEGDAGNTWGGVAKIVVGVRGGELRRRGFPPETKYRAHRCGVVQTSGGGVGDTWGKIFKVVVGV